MRHFLAKFSSALIAYGPWGIFLLSALDSAGVPLPAAIDLLLLDIGVHSASTPARAYLAALLATMGSLAGNIALFQAARHGRRLFGKTAPAKGDRRFDEWFRRYGLLTVFVPAVVPFVPLPLKVFVISAGAFRTPLAGFALVILVARCIRFFGMTWLALKLGSGAQEFLTHHGWYMAGSVLALMAVCYLLIRRRAPVGKPAAERSASESL